MKFVNFIFPSKIYAGNSAVVNEYDPRSMPHGNEMVVSNTIKLLQKRTPSSDRFQSFDSVLCFVMQDPNCKMKQLVVVSSVLYLHYLMESYLTNLCTCIYES